MCRRFGVSRWIKIGHRFDVESEMDKNDSWRPPEAEKVQTETFWGDLGPRAQIKRGPKSIQDRSKT